MMKARLFSDNELASRFVNINEERHNLFRLSNPTLRKKRDAESKISITILLYCVK